MNLSTPLLLLLFSLNTTLMADDLDMLYDPDANAPEVSQHNEWRLITDGVMGGVSSGRLTRTEIDGRTCMRLQGEVSLENNGGFIQMSWETAGTAAADATGYRGVSIDVTGNGETYGLHLRTGNLWFPWQSYRAEFDATGQWSTIQLPFDRFQPYKTGSDADLGRLVRIGVFAIGRPFEADLCVGRLALYR